MTRPRPPRRAAALAALLRAAAAVLAAGCAGPDETTPGEEPARPDPSGPGGALSVNGMRFACDETLPSQGGDAPCKRFVIVPGSGEPQGAWPDEVRHEGRAYECDARAGATPDAPVPEDACREYVLLPEDSERRGDLDVDPNVDDPQAATAGPEAASPTGANPAP